MRSLLILVSLGLLAAGCFSPDLRDCTVTCTGSDECGGDQVCGGGFCRAADATCPAAGSGSSAAKVALRVEVMGEGNVVAANLGTCSSSCTWMVAQGSRVQLDAMRIEDKDFEHWTTSNCTADDPSCVLTLTTETFVGAKFK
jgi:hypothetical protein